MSNINGNDDNVKSLYILTYGYYDVFFIDNL